MDAQCRLCMELVDEVDLLIANSRTKTGRNGKLLVLSQKRKNGPKSLLFSQKKIQLLRALKEAFIEPRTKSLKMSALLLFCHDAGLAVVTYKCRPYQGASFTVRTPGFDIAVESLY